MVDVVAHETWVKCWTRRGRRIDVTGETIVRLDCSGAVMFGARVLGCVVEFGRFSGADLGRADFRDSVMVGGVFDGAMARGARFDRCDLRKALFRGCDMRGAVLRDAQCDGASFDGADLRGADLTGASLMRVNWGNVDLSRTVGVLDGGDVCGRRVVGVDHGDCLMVSVSDHWLVAEDALRFMRRDQWRGVRVVVEGLMERWRLSRDGCGM